jgi:hypothetical protein
MNPEFMAQHKTARCSVERPDDTKSASRVFVPFISLRIVADCVTKEGA